MVKPNALDVYISIGELYKLQGKPDWAEREYKRAIDIEPRSPKPYLELARIYMSINQIKRSQETYKIVLELDPQNWKAVEEYAWTLSQGRRSSGSTCAI